MKINNEYLELCRRIKGYSVIGLCREIGITKATYYAIFNSKPRYIRSSTLIKLAKVLQLDLNTLLCLPEAKKTVELYGK